MVKHLQTKVQKTYGQTVFSYVFKKFKDKNTYLKLQVSQVQCKEKIKQEKVLNSGTIILLVIHIYLHLINYNLFIITSNKFYGSAKRPDEKKSKYVKQTLADLILAHHRL